MGLYGHSQWDAKLWLDGDLHGAGKKSRRSSGDLS